MPQIPTYEDHITAQGHIGSRASAADMGAAVGVGMQHMGSAISEAGDVMHRIEEDQGRLWAYGATADTFEQLKLGYRDAVNALDPNDPKFSEKFAQLNEGFPQKIQDATQKLFDTAPSRSARKMVASHMATSSRTLTGMVAAEAARVNAEWTVTQENRNIKGDQDSVAADPSNENFNVRLEGLKQRIGGLTTIDPTLKMKAIEKHTNELSWTQVDVLSRSRSKEFLLSVNPQGGRVTRNGGVRGAVPSGAPTIDISDAAPTTQTVWPLVIKQESGGKQSAVSDKGAVGVAQVMPGTGPEAAALAGLPWDENKFKTDAKYNEALGKAYFEKQVKDFGGNYAMALAAYNWGPARVQNAIAKWGSTWLDHAPKETQNYVAAIASGLPSSAQVQMKSSMVAEDRPQVQALTEEEIAKAKPAIAGWENLTWEQKVRAVRNAESTMGGRLAEDRAEMDKAIQDAMASRQDGKPYDMKKFDRGVLVNLYGDVNGNRKYDLLQEADQIGGFVEQMAKMPTAQALTFIQQHSPNGGEEYANKGPMWERVQRAYQQLHTLRNKDYMAWAQASGVGDVKPVDFSTPDAFGKSVGARIAAAKMGVNEFQSEAHLLSKAEADALSEKISKETPAKQAEFMKNLRYATANDPAWYQDTLAMIAPKNTMLAYAGGMAVKQGSVQTAGGWQNGEQVASYILEGAHILQGKDIDDPTHSGRPMAFNEQLFRQAFWNAVGPDAFAGPDAQISGMAASDVYQAVKNYVAADVYHRGIDPRNMTPQQVENAVKAVTGGTRKVNGSTLFIPWGMAEKEFDQKFPRAVDTALVDSGLKGTPLDAPDGFKYRNAQDGQYYVLNANGQRVIGPHGYMIVDIRNLVPRAQMKVH